MMQCVLISVAIMAIIVSTQTGHVIGQESSSAEDTTKSLFTIEGKVFPPVEMTPDFVANTKVSVNYGDFLAFIKSDGSFTVTNLPAGTYLVDVNHPDFFFEPIRVDITSKGKIRARKVNYMQFNAVNQVNYPLKFKIRGPFKYFTTRETWKLTDVLMNPMVLMMIVPLLSLGLLPKLIGSDPETKKEMENMQFPKYEVPELSEMMTSLFKGPQAAGAIASGTGAGSSGGRGKGPSGGSRKRN